MQVNIAPSWRRHLEEAFQQPYFKNLVAFVKAEYRHYTVYLPGRKICSAFELCSFEATQVVILSQDPYHGPRQANGLCFSVNDGVPIPPSLLNIFTEIHHDVSKPIPTPGNLARWAQQGVLLLILP